MSTVDGGTIEIDGGFAIVAGPVGPQGIQGIQGVAGSQGAQGIQGQQGPQGIRGDVVVVSSPDGGFVSVDGGVAIVTGPVGPQGAQGGAGPQGAAGANGQSVTGSSEGPSSNCQYGGVRYDSVSGTAYVCNGAPGQVQIVAVADGGELAFDGGLLVVSGPVGPQGIQGQQGLQGNAGGQGAPGPQGPVGPSNSVRVVDPDGGLVLLAFGPQWFWSPASECFFENGAGLPVVDTVEFDGPGCSGQALFSGGPISSNSSGAAQLGMTLRCFLLPSYGASSNRPGRLKRPSTMTNVTIRSVATRTGSTTVGTCTNVVDFVTPAFLFEDVAPPRGLPNQFDVLPPQ